MDPKEEKLLEHYLARIGLPGPPPISEQGLFLAHMHQAFAIPFENISVYLGDSVSLSPESLVDKLVLRKRGGYCFELNGLLAWALRRFQFSLEAHLARVQVHNPRPGPLTHEILIAQLGTRRWLCDVGFGGPGLHHPMPFELGRIEHQGGDDFRLTQHPDFGYCLEHLQPDGAWQPRYFFHTTRVLPVDIVMGNYFSSNWSGSIFRKWLMCAKPTQKGKLTLYNRDFKLRSGSELKEEKVVSGAALVTLLRDQFKIELQPVEAERLVKAFDSGEPVA